MVINATGALATGITTAVVLVAKFTEGAWITVLLIPAIILLMYSIHRHYMRIEEGTTLDGTVKVDSICEPIVLIPIERLSTVAEKTLRFAWSISKEITFVHVQCDDDEDHEKLQQQWKQTVELPARNANLPVPALVILPSPYRFVVKPLLDYALRMEEEHQDRHLAILVPELIEHHWYHYFLHNNRARLLKALLELKENPKITVINIPWYLRPYGNKPSVP